MSRGVLVKSNGCVLAGDPIYNGWNVRNFLWMVCSWVVLTEVSVPWGLAAVQPHRNTQKSTLIINWLA